MALGYCDLEHSWSTEVLPYLPFILEHCPNNETFCRVDDESRIFDHNLTLAAISAMKTAAVLDAPWFIAVGFKKPHAPWGVPTKYFDQWNASTLPTAKHPVASEEIPNLALIDNFQVVLDKGDQKFAWSPKVLPLPTPVQQQLRHAYYASVSYIDEQVGLLLVRLLLLLLFPFSCRFIPPHPTPVTPIPFTHKHTLPRVGRLGRARAD